jgi:hypothetical protein
VGKKAGLAGGVLLITSLLAFESGLQAKVETFSRESPNRRRKVYNLRVHRLCRICTVFCKAIQLTDQELLAFFHDLWAEADALWEANQAKPEYALYVSADYKAIFHQLCELRGRVHTVLEWGSGLGVMTIMANRLGFDAYGIEAEPGLVKLAEGLAKKYQANPRFVVGSFIPAEYEEDLAAGEEFIRTLTTATPAYDEMDMQLRDFDLVYAFPWPDEHGIYRSIMRRHASRHALYMRYDAREGLSLSRVGKRTR